MVWNIVLLKPWITVTEKWVLFPKIFEDLEATRKLLLQTGKPKHFRSCEISAVIKRIVPNVNTILFLFLQTKAQLALLLLLVLTVAI